MIRTKSSKNPSGLPCFWRHQFDSILLLLTYVSSIYPIGNIWNCNFEPEILNIELWLYLLRDSCSKKPIYQQWLKNIEYKLVIIEYNCHFYGKQHFHEARFPRTFSWISQLLVEISSKFERENNPGISWTTWIPASDIMSSM